jgi:drug/metabolite transporter (DMT)-like permease
MIGQRPDGRTLTALAAALAGLALLVLDAPGQVTAVGVVFALVAALRFAMPSRQSPT